MSGDKPSIASAVMTCWPLKTPATSHRRGDGHCVDNALRIWWERTSAAGVWFSPMPADGKTLSDDGPSKKRRKTSPKRDNNPILRED